MMHQKRKVRLQLRLHQPKQAKQIQRKMTKRESLRQREEKEEGLTLNSLRMRAICLCQLRASRVSFLFWILNSSRFHSRVSRYSPVFLLCPVISISTCTCRDSKLGHQAELHNNRGIAKDQLSYIIDPPKSLEEEAKTLAETEMSKMTPGCVWTGILTSTEHSPSVGEWQEKISKSALFAYYSMTCLLHKFPPSLIADLSIFEVQSHDNF